MTTKALPPAERSSYQRPRSGNDILSKRSRWTARFGRFFRSNLPWVLLFGFIFLFASWMGSSRSNFQTGMFLIQMAIQIVFALFFAIMQFVAIFWFMGRTRMDSIRPEDPKSVTFKDYWGQPNLVALVQQWISLLSDRDAFVKMGGKYINGVLLYGPPGTGKTLLAKAMAGEAGIAFISVEGSGFRGMFWGVDVLRMIQFVGKAKKLAREYGACIAYIDEIDAVGQSRGGVMGGQGGMGMMGGMMGGMGGGSGALTRLLYEMDGVENKGRFEKLRDRWYQFIGKEPQKRNWHVLFMGSTNRPDVLDPALLRPGRFDQKIQVDAPDKTGRREVIKGYLSRVKHDETVDIEAIVEDTPHATPAEIAAAITKDAVRIALFNGRDRVSQQDIDKAIQEQDSGLAQPIEELDPEQRRVVAYHEAGHAVAVHYVMPEKRIVRVTIVRHSGSMGYVMPVDRVEIYTEPLRRFAANIVVSMAGRVSERMFTGEAWNSTGGDFKHIRIRLWQLYQYGYFGPPVMGAENTGSNAIPASAAPMIERFWRVMEEQTEDLLRQHTSEIEAIAQALLEKGTLSNEEVMALLGDNGWQQTDTAFPRPPARLPQPTLLPPLPAPVAVAVAMTEAAPATAPLAEVPDSQTAVAVVEPASPARMVKPPKPADFARRRPPATPEPEKPAEPAKSDSQPKPAH